MRQGWLQGREEIDLFRGADVRAKVRRGLGGKGGAICARVVKGVSIEVGTSMSETPACREDTARCAPNLDHLNRHCFGYIPNREANAHLPGPLALETSCAACLHVRHVYKVDHVFENCAPPLVGPQLSHTMSVCFSTRF